uniref:PCI domain-containing protein n=1 Tax=Trichuris muris TaxID=70415 RepID=A0A5S6QDQ3_TRIMR
MLAAQEDLPAVPLLPVRLHSCTLAHLYGGTGSALVTEMDGNTGATDTPEGAEKNEHEKNSAELAKNGLEEARKLVEDGRIHDALELLAKLEKRTRLLGDAKSNSLLQVTIVNTCFAAGKMDSLISYVERLAKKKSHIKEAVDDMVRACCAFVSKIADKNSMVKLIEILREITIGKTSVETEWFQLTAMLSWIKEEEGDIEAARAILIELDPLACHMLSSDKKLALLIRQLRLCVLVGDFARARTIKNHIPENAFTGESEECQRMLIQYHELMIKLCHEDGDDYLCISKHYEEMSRIPIISNDEASRHMIMKLCITYAILSAPNDEKMKLLDMLAKNELRHFLPDYFHLVDLFIEPQLIHFQNDVAKQLGQPALADVGYSTETGVFNLKTSAGQKRWEELRIRTVQHNIQVISKYYSHISLARLAELAENDTNGIEELLSEMIDRAWLKGAKINQPEGYIEFATEEDTEKLLCNSGNEMSEMLEILANTAALVNREERNAAI